MTKRIAVVLVALLVSGLAFGQVNGKLQLHFMDVGQGDGAVLISPKGEVVLFDNGARGACDKPVSYLQQLGVKHIDYNIVSHYHDDHIGCTAQILSEFPLVKNAIDRGGTQTNPAFRKYLSAIGRHRVRVQPGTKITLDADTATPVVITIAALNGNGVRTKNENDLSLVAVVRFGEFDAVIGGDLSGEKTGSYDDIETSVAPQVGQVEVYKVHHHCSRYSTNEAWLTTTKPKAAIISVGNGNRFKHPTADCLLRIHHAGTITYWTENGNGTAPSATDIVGGNIIVQASPNPQTFTISYGKQLTDTYPVWGGTAVPASDLPAFAWSKASSVYHYRGCSYVENISPVNLERGNAPPSDKTLHKNCPK